MPVAFGGCTELREIEVLGLDGERTLVGARCEERCAKTYWQRVVSLRIPNASTGVPERRDVPADAPPQKVLRCILSALGARVATGAHEAASLGLRLQCTAPPRADIERLRERALDHQLDAAGCSRRASTE